MAASWLQALHVNEAKENSAMTGKTFAAIVRKYTRVRKLTRAMLNELVERIEVFHAEKADGIHVQRLVIHYNCGPIDIPEKLPAPEVQMQTRKGVVVSYAPGGSETA